jgi:hypothetical protein
MGTEDGRFVGEWPKEQLEFPEHAHDVSETESRDVVVRRLIVTVLVT